MPVEFAAAGYRFGHSMVRPSYRANFTSGATDSTTSRQPVLRPGVRPDPDRLNGPVTSDRDDLLGGYPARAPLHRMADLLRSRRRPGQKQQENRPDHLQRPVHPAASLRSPRTPKPAPRGCPNEPAAPTHLGTTVRPSDRQRDGRPEQLSAEPTSPTSRASTRHSPPAHHFGTTSSPKPRPSTTANISGPSAEESSPKPSSACSAPTPPAISASTRASRKLARARTSLREFKHGIIGCEEPQALNPDPHRHSRVKESALR